MVDGDGTGDRFIAGGAAAVAPAWRSGPGHVVAYATERGAVVAFSADSRRRIFATAPSAASPLAAVERRSPAGDARGPGRTARRRRPAGLDLDAAGRLARPLGDGRARAAIASPSSPRDGRTSRVLLIAKAHPSRVLFAGPGSFAAPRWSPEGRWLLLPWPSADQWLFLEPGSGTGKLHAVAHLAKQFSPGDPTAARFPSVVGWCCTVH